MDGVDWLLRQRVALVMVACGTVAFLRTGWAYYANIRHIEAAFDLPRPLDEYRGPSVLTPLVMRALGQADSVTSWQVVFTALTVGVMVIAAAMIIARFDRHDQRVFVAVALAASALPVVMLVRISHYDVWLLGGAVILALGRQPATAALGGALMGLTNLEQSVVAIATFAAVGYLLGADIRRRAALAFAVVVGVFALLRLWYLAYDVPWPSRSDLFGSRLEQSLDGFFGSIHVQVYSWFSAAWLTVIAVVQRWRVLAALIALPALSTMTTLDGTRVFVACVMPAFLLVIIHAAETLPAERLRAIACWTFVAMVLAPSVSTFVNGEVVVPWP